jgi:hypothetical protein
MNIFRKALPALVLACFCLVVQAQGDFCNTQNKCVQAGEKLNFKVFYNLSALWVAAGEANFTTKLETLNGRSVFHITGDGETYKSYDWIFRVRDRYETYLDQETLLPQKFVRNVDEGGTKFTNNVIFDQANKKAYSNKKTFDVPQCVQDVLSAIYYARNIDYNKYKPGSKIPFSMFLDDQVYNLYIRYAGKEKIKTKYGTFNAIKITPLLIKGTIFKGGEDMVVYVSDDNNHIPLRVDSPILVGSIKVDMMGYSNLKYPLTSLIKKK